MSPFSIVFVVLYLISLCFYFYTRTSGKTKLRAINKYIMATLYLIYAIVQFSINYETASYHIILMASLFLAYLGDLFLVYHFNRGGDFFLCGNVCFAVYYIALLSDNGFRFVDFYWVIIAWVVIVALLFILSSRFPNVIKFGRMKYPMLLYLCSITLHGMFGLGAVILLPKLSYLLLGIGSILFMISDFILSVDKFVITNNKWITRANSLFYFVGLLLIVLSLGY